MKKQEPSDSAANFFFGVSLVGLLVGGSAAFIVSEMSRGETSLQNNDSIDLRISDEQFDSLVRDINNKKVRFSDLVEGSIIVQQTDK